MTDSDSIFFPPLVVALLLVLLFASIPLLTSLIEILILGGTEEQAIQRCIEIYGQEYKYLNGTYCHDPKTGISRPLL